MKKVLVLMSTYNGEKYIEEQIKSLINQKNVDIHILIRDDGSTDNTIDVLKKIKNKRITCIFAKNIGACDSFFELIKEAPNDYDYYALCDQDDFWLEEKLSVAVNKLDYFPNEKPALYYSGQILTDKNLNIMSEHKLDTKKSIYANWIFNQMAGCTSVFNNTFLMNLKLYIPKKVKYHDVWCYKLCAALDGNIFVDQSSYILYRQHGNNVVGLNNGLKGKIERAKKYIFVYNCSSFANEILNGYKQMLKKEWIDFLECIVTSNNKMSSRMKLIRNKKIVFNSISLRCLFVIKVILRKI